MGGLVALVCPRTGSRSTLFGLKTDCWRSTGTSLRTRPRGKSQPAAFQCSARRFPPDDRFRKANPMKDAKTLLLEFLAAVTHGQDAAALFAEDGAVELPFLHSLGIPWRHRGRQAIRELQDSLARLYLDFAFEPEDTHVLIDTPEQVFAEYMAHPTVAATGRTVHHMFTGRLVAENGQIKLLRESLNPVAVAQALLPGGVKDLPDPEKVIFSVPPDYRS